MKRVCIPEYGRVYRGRTDTLSGSREGRQVFLSDPHFRQLQRFDERTAGSEGRQIFDWRYRYASARQWVGVIQIPGLSVEILPKLTVRADAEHDAMRRNLLFMLTVGKLVPLRERDFANQALARAPLLHVLIQVFARRLFTELKRGREHSYLRQQDNQPKLKGKLCFSKHVAQNVARRDRFFVAFDEFTDDTGINRIFRATCRRLLALSIGGRVQEQLTYCLMLLDEVTDVVLTAVDFERIVLTRQNERFAPLLDFCRMMFGATAPLARAGETRVFSLLFDMNAVFECFVTEFLRRHVLRDPSLEGLQLRAQGRGRARHLVYRPPRQLPTEDYRPHRHGRGVLKLKPDIVIGTEGGSQKLVIDAKWKRLSASLGGRWGIGRNDLYQLFAYAHNFKARHNVLLYPKPDDSADELGQLRYDLPRGPNGELFHISVRLINLERDLFAERRQLAAEMGQVLGDLMGVQLLAESDALGGT